MSIILRLNQLQGVRNAILLTQRNVRLISTSPKKSDTATISAKTTETASASKTQENWVSWGWDYKNKTTDDSWMNSSFFFSVTLCLVFGTFYLAYTPDNMLRDWSQREAYLKLRRREAAGLEPISSDYVDPASIELPSDEDLGDTEIII